MLNLKYKHFLIGLALMLAALLGVVPNVLAGGWTVTTLDELPTEVVAGKPLTVGFMIRQHGKTPFVDEQVMVHATHSQSGEKISVRAEAEGVPGHYVAVLKFPQAGTWEWGIASGLMPEQQPMPNLEVLDAPAMKNVNAQGVSSEEKTSLRRENPPSTVPLGIGVIGAVGTVGALIFWLRSRTPLTLVLLTGMAATSAAGFGLAASPSTLTMFKADSQRLEAVPLPAAAPTSVELGQALYVAKGCIVCHNHSALREVRQSFSEFSVGPELPSVATLAAEPEFLHTWLKDPAALKPDTQMPNLELKKAEIEALVAFLKNPESKAAANVSPAEPAGQPIIPAPSKAELKPAELFFIRAQGAKGPLVAHDMANNVEQFRLPPGMPAADGSYYFAATARRDSTLLQVFKGNSSHLEHNFSLPDRWALSGVSPTGRWLALTRLPSDSEQQARVQTGVWHTDIQIIEAASGKVAHTMKLEGNFEVETISAAGDSLFLIQYQPAVEPTQYLIRLYDLSAEILQPEPLRSKIPTEEVMTGLAWGGVASVDGRWLLTLYLNTTHNHAFIHTLNLVDKYPLCIDLPSGQGNFDQLKYYSLTIAPNGRTVYAANAALGIVVEVSLDDFQVTRQVEFPASALPETEAITDSETPTNYSVLAKDGQTLYFSSGWDVWSYDTKAHQVSGPYLSDTAVRGLALSADSQRLFVATTEQPLLIDLAEGDKLSLSSN
jgi:hypothetical protein